MSSNLVTTAKATGGISFDTAKCTGGVKKHPFNQEDLPNSGVCYEHTMIQTKTEYAPLALDLAMTGTNKPTGSPFADDSTAFYVGDSTPTDAGNGCVSFTRTFSQVPANYTQQLGLISRSTPSVSTPNISPRDYQYHHFMAEDQYLQATGKSIYVTGGGNSYTYDYFTSDSYSYARAGDTFKWGVFGQSGSGGYQCSASPTFFVYHPYPYGSYNLYNFASDMTYRIYYQTKQEFTDAGDDMTGFTPIITRSVEEYGTDSPSSGWINKTITNALANTSEMQLRVKFDFDYITESTNRTIDFSTYSLGTKCNPISTGTDLSRPSGNGSEIEASIAVGQLCTLSQSRSNPVSPLIRYKSAITNKYNAFYAGGLSTLRLISFGGGEASALSQAVSVFKDTYNTNTSSTSQSITFNIAFGRLDVSTSQPFTSASRFNKASYTNLGVEFGGSLQLSDDPEINVPAEARYEFVKTDQPENISLQKKFLIPSSLTPTSSPSITEYLALRDSNQKILAENQFIERYMGNIYKKTSIFSTID